MRLSASVVLKTAEDHRRLERTEEARQKYYFEVVRGNFSENFLSMVCKLRAILQPGVDEPVHLHLFLTDLEEVIPQQLTTCEDTVPTDTEPDRGRVSPLEYDSGLSDAESNPYHSCEEHWVV